MPTCLYLVSSGEAPGTPAPRPPAAALTLRVRGQLLGAQSPPPNPPSLPCPLGHLLMDGSVGASPGEQEKGGGGEAGRKARAKPEFRREGSEQKRQGGGGQAGWAPVMLAEPQEEAKDQQIPSGPSQTGCRPGFPKGLGRAGIEGLASSLPSPRGPWVLLLVAPAPQGPGRTCWAQPGQGQRPGPPTPHPSQRQHRLRSLWPLYPRMQRQAGQPPVLCPRRAWVLWQADTPSQGSCWPAAAMAAAAQGRQSCVALPRGGQASDPEVVTRWVDGRTLPAQLGRQN